jgi:hypothetical protein
MRFSDPDKDRDNALRIFNHIVDQMHEESLSRNDLSLAYLTTWDILKDSESKKEGREKARKKVGLLPAEDLAAGPEIAGPEPAGNRFTIGQQRPASPLVTVTGVAQTPDQVLDTLNDPCLPVFGEQVWDNSGANHHDARDLEEESFPWTDFLAVQE